MGSRRKAQPSATDVAQYLSSGEQGLHQIDIAVAANHVAIGVEELRPEFRPNFRKPGTDGQRDLDVLGILPATGVGFPRTMVV